MTIFLLLLAISKRFKIQLPDWTYFVDLLKWINMFFLKVSSLSRSQDILGRCRVSFGEDSRHLFLSSQLSTG